MSNYFFLYPKERNSTICMSFELDICWAVNSIRDYHDSSKYVKILVEETITCYCKALQDFNVPYKQKSE